MIATLCEVEFKPAVATMRLFVALILAWRVVGVEGEYIEGEWEGADEGGGLEETGEGEEKGGPMTRRTGRFNALLWSPLLCIVLSGDDNEEEDEEEDDDDEGDDGERES